MKEILLNLVLAVIAAAVPVLTAHAVAYIRKAKEKAVSSTDNTKVQGYIVEISDAVANAVAAISQTYVDALKKAGAFSKEAQEEAAEKALSACLTSISPAAIDYIKGAYNDLKIYLSTKIEAEVRKQKGETVSSKNMC